MTGTLSRFMRFVMHVERFSLELFTNSTSFNVMRYCIFNFHFALQAKPTNEDMWRLFVWGCT